MLRADVSNCYRSFYTHTVPWALHTRAIAKQRRSDFALLGNRLDYWIRQSQDQQTIGIPIGPDSSYLIGEIILSAIDVIVANNLPELKGYRAVDDYEFYFFTYSEAEHALNVLESALAQYQLTLNDTKTGILELPQPVQQTWPIELSTFVFRDTPRKQQTDLGRYFSLAFELAERYPYESVLRYALSRLASVQIHSSNWELYESILLQCASSEPGTLRFVLEALSRYVEQRYTLSLQKIEDVLNAQIVAESRSAHASEMAWAVYSLLALNLSLNDESTRVLGQVEDPFVALLALDAQSTGLCRSLIDTTKWEALMQCDELYGRYWLLSYEANVQGWLPSGGGRDHVLMDPSFAFLKQHGVRFYDRYRPTGFNAAYGAGGGYDHPGTAA